MDAFDTNVSDGGVGIESIAADPVNANNVYAVINYAYGTTYYDSNNVNYTYAGEVMQSADKGASWTPMGLATAGRAIYVGSNSGYRTDTGERLAIDPNKPSCLYFASSRDGLWRKNGAADWARLDSSLPSPSTLPGYYANGQNGDPNGDFPGYTFVLFDKSTGSTGNATQTVYLGVWGKRRVQKHQ